MSGGNILFLAADTPRSQAYAQAFAARGVALDHVILFGRSGTAQLGQTELPYRSELAAAVPLPDLRIPLTQSVNSLARDVRRIEAESINDPAILSMAASVNADLVVYSGFGGQLVGPDLLSLGPPILHAHSGWLPDYRGSTTVYYSLLAGMGCGVSVISLVSAIDQGPIVARRRYSAPPAGLDIDYFYDSAIRADLVADVVVNWQSAGKLDQVESSDKGTDYYVVHPLLKHLALLSLEATDKDEGSAD